MTFPNVSEISSRDKILDAAEHLFAQRGYAGVGLREVAEAVGLGKSSLFHHFKNKPELYAAVCGRILTRIGSRLGEALARGGSPVERLERLLDELVDVLAGHPNDARLLLRSLFEDDDLITRPAIDHLHSFYRNAAVERRHVQPQPGQRIGHFGFFAERSRETLWREAIAWLRAHT